MDVELQETPDRAGVYDFVINNERFSREFDYRFTATRQEVIGEVAANLGLCRKGDRNTPKEYQ
jgi:hypothetical protein